MYGCTKSVKSNHLVEINNKNPETMIHVLESVWIVTVSFSCASLLFHLNYKKTENIRSTNKTIRCFKVNDVMSCCKEDHLTSQWILYSLVCSKFYKQLIALFQSFVNVGDEGRSSLLDLCWAFFHGRMWCFSTTTKMHYSCTQCSFEPKLLNEPVFPKALTSPVLYILFKIM